MCLQNVSTLGAICPNNQGACAEIIAHNVFILSSSTIRVPLHLHKELTTTVHFCEKYADGSTEQTRGKILVGMAT